ncbi:hypothetical protein PHLCEN_2v3845 [Hermanssonia centrifuga]|uniref:Uncharacterized protein n=1 Tax=Hermanssonia centrifuga TaxID=98765 RepID=A0A2R6QBH3_9APHY|nr:hypothetical protein PHLCEN_2v3845 [Hermanssonia centrifuga]
MSRTVSLPVGFHPGWENEDETINSEGAEMRSVADSLVIFQSLRQSRDKWLTSTFPKFSVRGRGGKPPEVTPPPHHTKCLGKFELTIGPHIFQNTAVYEVSYLPHAEPTPPAAQSIPSAASISPIQQPGPADQSAHNSQYSSHESLAPNISVTPELSSKVNAALATNPILRNLFHLVGSGRATEDQVATLAALVHSMGNLPPDPRVLPQPPHQSSTHEPSASFLSSPPSVAPLRTKPFDVVIEFQEKLPDKWIIPRGYALLETTPSSTSSTKLDAILTVSPLINIGGPEPSEILPPGTSGPDTASPVVKLHWTGLIQPVIDLFARWCNDEQNIAENQGKLKPPASTFRFDPFFIQFIAK